MLQLEISALHGEDCKDCSIYKLSAQQMYQKCWYSLYHNMVYPSDILRSGCIHQSSQHHFKIILLVFYVSRQPYTTEPAIHLVLFKLHGSIIKSSCTQSCMELQLLQYLTDLQANNQVYKWKLLQPRALKLGKVSVNSELFL